MYRVSGYIVISQLGRLTASSFFHFYIIYPRLCRTTGIGVADSEVFRIAADAVQIFLERILTVTRLRRQCLQRYEGCTAFFYITQLHRAIAVAVMEGPGQTRAAQ